MEFSLKRVNALFIKELKDFYRNPNILIMCLLPLFFAILYGNIFGGKMSSTFILMLCVLMNFTMVGCLVMSMLIAEEKEKNTLRTLMLSPISPVEFLAGKSMITAILCMAINIIIFFILKVNMVFFIQFLVITFITTISMLFLGAIVGLLSKNQMETGTVGFPIYMGLLLVPMFSGLNKTLKAIANLLPTYHCGEALQKIFDGQGLLSIKYNFLALVIWIFVSIVLFAFVYKKKSLDK